MVPWLIFAGGLLAGATLAQAQDPSRISPGLAPDDAVPSPEVLEKIQVASAGFLPHAAGVAAQVKQDHGGWFSSWREAASFLPGLTEAVAMYFSMMDEETPILIKGVAAVALVYLISPLDIIPDEIPVLGQLDDITVVYFAYRQVAPWVRPQHYAEATQWLISQGIDPKPFFELGKILDMEAWAARYETERGSVPQLPGPPAP